MPRRHVSRDLKERIPYLRYVEGFKVKEIERLLGVKKSMIYQTLNYHREYGVTYNPAAFLQRGRGRRRTLDYIDLRLLKSLLSQDACLYLDELQEELLVRRGISVSVQTLLRSLRRLHFSRKSVSIHALERNDMDRSIYMNTFAELVTDPAMVMFIDEAAKNKKNPTRKMGWSLKGQRSFQRRCFVRSQRFSILPVLTLDGIIAHDIIPGSVTSAIFVDFLQEHVVGYLSLVHSDWLMVLPYRSHLQIHIQAHEVFSSLITATSIMPMLFENLSKMKHVSCCILPSIPLY